MWGSSPRSSSQFSSPSDLQHAPVKLHQLVAMSQQLASVLKDTILERMLYMVEFIFAPNLSRAVHQGANTQEAPEKSPNVQLTKDDPEDGPNVRFLQNFRCVCL